MDESILITAPQLFDGLGDQVDEDVYVVVEDGLIADIGRRADLGADASKRFDRAIELPAGTTLLPGLINMHTHLSFSAAPTMFDDQVHESDAVKMIRIVENMRAALQVGITTVRDCGTWPRLALPARDAVERGLIAGPRIVTSGAITTTGGHCWYCATEADSEPEVRKAVRAHVKDGVDFIKLFATGGNVTPGSNSLIAQYTEAELAAATDEARKAGRRTAAHAHGVDGVRHSIAARVTTIEHCSFQTEAGIGWDAGMAGEIADAGIYVCPTIFRGVAKLADDPNYTLSAREQMYIARRGERFELTRKLAERGVMLVSGNDGGVPHCLVSDFPGDLVSTAEGTGLSPAVVLRSATSVAATALGRDDIGAIARGKAADLLVVHGDPVADIHAIENTAMVFARGQAVS